MCYLRVTTEPVFARPYQFLKFSEALNLRLRWVLKIEHFHGTITKDIIEKRLKSILLILFRPTVGGHSLAAQLQIAWPLGLRSLRTFARCLFLSVLAIKAAVTAFGRRKQLATCISGAALV